MTFQIFKRGFGSLAIAALLALPLVGSPVIEAEAGCIGSSSFQTCTDSSGNSYTVNRFGNTTQMRGYNRRTGSSWSQRSTTMGGTTFHNGTTNGRNWNMQQRSFGNMQTYSGSDSRGNSFSYTCGSWGCN